MIFKNMTVKEIKKFLEKEENTFKYIGDLLSDQRKTVNKIGRRLKKQKKELKEEKNRILNMWDFENDLINDSDNYLIAGIDEVGRGPLAGPVVAAAVILNKNDLILNVKDSKKLNLEMREDLYETIYNRAVDIGIGIIDHKTIDELNILNATKLAMEMAINDLNNKPGYLLIDALELENIDIEQFSIIKGDNKSISIAAASIIAKVTRDRIMYRYHERYPDYGFISNVGYGTKEHREALKKHGPTRIHRRSFIGNLI